MPERFAVFASRVDEFITEQRETNARVEKRLQGIADDIGMLKGNVAVRATRDNAERIVEQVLNLHPLSILSRSDLIAMLRPKASEIERTWKNSFYQADLVMQSIADDGTVHYMAAEASYTADRRDTDRALHNADLLTRCTNAPAHAVVASVRNDHEVQALVDAGKVHWFQLTNRDLTPD